MIGKVVCVRNAKTFTIPLPVQVGWLFSVMVIGISTFHKNASAFSVDLGPSKPKPYIEITNLASPDAVNLLPASLVESWSTWVLDPSGQFSKIPDSDGFVNPASIDTFFQPLDLKPPMLQLAVGVHVREGRIRHIMPALDASFEGGRHRNRGLCSVPRAFKWIEFSSDFIRDWGQFQLKAFERKQIGDSWTQIAAISEGDIVSSTVEHAILCLAESAPDELGEGSHIIHTLIDIGRASATASASGNQSCCLHYPTNGKELCIILDDQDQDDIPNLEQDACGILYVKTAATMAGLESPYLPDVYKPLFEDDTLRNTAYDKFQEGKKK